MLTRTLSLKVRATLILLTIYAVVLVAGFAIAARASLSSEGQRHHAGPQIALQFATQDLNLTDEGLSLATAGSFMRLAARNPDLWLLAEYEGDQLTYGPVPPTAAELALGSYAALETARLHIAGHERPLSDAILERRGGALLIAGGVDPATITLGEVFLYFLSDGLFAVLMALGVLGLLAMLLAVPFLTASLRPASRQVAAIKGDNPDQRIDEARVPSEILPLARGFNAALDRLAEELVRSRRFIADAAHELRTPLAILTLQVDAIEEPRLKRDMGRVVARLSNLLAQMLDVQRLSLGGRQWSTFDLRGLAQEVVGDMAPLAIASGYELSLDARGGAVDAVGDSHALGRAIANLIGNAIAHGGGTGRIRVVLNADRSLDVIDDGPGVPATVRDHIFEPFRRERWDRDGCGLGLHMTRQIMRAHGGDAHCMDHAGGARFRLDFPEAEGRT